MALIQEAVGSSCRGTLKLNLRKCSSGDLRGEESRWIRRRDLGRHVIATLPVRRHSISLFAISPSIVPLSRVKFSSLPRPSGSRFRHVCQAKRGYEEEEKVIVYDEEGYDMDGYDKNGYDRRGYNRFGRDKLGLDEDGLDKFGIPGDAILDGPIREPDYHTYIDRNTGEPAPTYGFRNSLPNAAFWGDDLEEIQNSSPAFARAKNLDELLAANDDLDVGDEQEGREQDHEDDPGVSNDFEITAGRGRRVGAKRRKRKDIEAGEQSDEDSGTEGESATTTQVKKQGKGKKGGDDDDSQSNEEGEEEEEEEPSLGEIFGGYANRGYPLISGDTDTDPEALAEWDKEKALPKEKVWWNWRKPSPEEKPWSAWQKRPGDSDTVMAAAMAETGQIKLFGEKPTIAEATLARARKKVFYNERIEWEEERKEKIGALAYYKEWVKEYKGDTSKEAVEQQYEETGEEEGIQLLDMFAYQTAEEYRIMKGTDVRIRRDPLIMRMRPDQIKQVWGGDPVYPTINYEHDPDELADFRTENMHEPIPDIVEMLRESGRLITQEELKAQLEKESAENDEIGGFYGLTGAVDIGEEDEEEIDEDEEVDDVDEEVSLAKKATVSSSKKRPGRRKTFELDETVMNEVEADDDEDDVAEEDDDNVEMVIHGGNDEDDET